MPHIRRLQKVMSRCILETYATFVLCKVFCLLQKLGRMYCRFNKYGTYTSLYLLNYFSTLAYFLSPFHLNALSAFVTTVSRTVLIVAEDNWNMTV